MRAIGYLVALAAMCAALGSQVADVVVAAKTPAKTAASTAQPKGVAAASTAVTAKAIAHTALNKVPGVTGKSKKSRAPPAAGHHQTAGRRLAGEDAAGGIAIAGHGLEHGVHLDSPAAALTTPAPSSAASPAGSGSAGNSTGSGPAGAGKDAGLEGEAGATDNTTLAVARSSPSNHPFVKQGAYPFVVTVQKVCNGCHTRLFCGGALLAAQWAISLPQCAETHPGEGLVVRAGDAFIWPGDKTPTQKVMEVVWHEANSSTDDYPKYDAVLMRTENPFALNENLYPIGLVPQNFHMELGSVSLLGWSPPGHVQQVELNLTHGSLRPHEDCMKIAPQEVLPWETLCVQPVEPLLERCPYDVGDPIFLETDPPQLVGLLMRWYQPCSPTRPVVGFRINSLTAWINERITERPSPRPPRPTEEATTAASSPFTVITMPPVTLPPGTPPTTHHTTTSEPSTTTTHHTTTTEPSTTTTHHTTTSEPSTPPRPGGAHVRPMTVSSSSASGALSNSTSTSDTALLPGHMESSLSYSLGTAGVEPSKPALSNSVSVGWANCRDVGGALGMSYALAYSFISEGTASAASTVNATCLDVNAVQSQGWSISTSGGSAPVSVRAFIVEHLASIPGLPRQPSLKYL